jgi:ATP-binding cassette subfamily F protein 3
MVEASPAAATGAPAAAGSKRLNPIKLRQMQDRRTSIEEEVTKLEVEIADYEAELSNFVSVEETARVSALLDQRRSDLEKLMQEWEEVVQAIECSS